jgi:beta-lactamase class D
MIRRLLIMVLATAALGGCASNNIDIDNGLARHFEKEGVKGTFGMFDNSRGRFTIYDMERFRKRYSPASTFKIVNALVGLQTGRLTTDSSVIPWDGTVRDNPEWNQDLSLYRAFRLSSYGHFQTLARSIGRDTMQYWLDTLKYGNMRMGPQVDAFWLNDTLRISPDEQLGLVKRLYFRQLPFRASVQESVKKMMLQENNATYQLAYKTGLGRTEKGMPMAWVVGWIEESRHVYPFVLNVETDADKADALVEARIRILRSILEDIGFFRGRM